MDFVTHRSKRSRSGEVLLIRGLYSCPALHLTFDMLIALDGGLSKYDYIYDDFKQILAVLQNK